MSVFYKKRIFTKKVFDVYMSVAYNHSLLQKRIFTKKVSDVFQLLKQGNFFKLNRLIRLGIFTSFCAIIV